MKEITIKNIVEGEVHCWKQGETLLPERILIQIKEVFKEKIAIYEDQIQELSSNPDLCFEEGINRRKSKIGLLYDLIASCD